MTAQSTRQEVTAESYTVAADRLCVCVCVMMQVGHLTEEVAALEDENRRLSEVIQTDQPHNEELLLHVKELQHVRMR